MNTRFSELKITIFLFLAISLISMLSLLDYETRSSGEFDKVNLLKKQSESIVAVSYVESPNREPASQENSSAGSRIVNVEFLCEKPKSAEGVQHKYGKLLMLNFKVCAKLANTLSVSLVNESNGFKAQVFKIEGDSYKTDYIQLSKGSNNIRVEVVLKDGQKLEDSLVILTGS